jgi:hypothetical protein
LCGSASNAEKLAALAPNDPGVINLVKLLER